MVFHVLTNAIAACAHGGRILVAARVEGEALRIRVQDDGCGMTSEALASCREPFFSTRPSGTGMGLTLCDRATEEVGGELRIESAPGRGTTVTMLLPIHGQRRSGPHPRLTE
jgi:signal transduction histidine kinase